ncbi:magnesium-translocating P-type ATPase [Collinsella sp. CLA-ER-H8]|uniref:magnesium-translocating P-type ATPase n=1 Tax=Collinsella sp. CLA-ER-H8 TaxID=3136229 RepID=UPI0032C16A5B
MLMLKTVTVLEAISKRRRTARPAAHTGLSKNTIFAATHSAEDALVLLDATANGLTVEQATERLNAVGPNTIEATTKTLARRIADAFIDPFAGILAALALVSLYIDVLAVPEPQRDPSTVIVIGTMLLVSGGMKFIQEARSGNAAEALKDLVSNTCTALRDGERIEIPFDELVPGDVIRLSAGDMVPADARIITARDLFVIESALTGESEAVEKTTAVTVVEGADGSALPLSACKNIVFTGTSVQNGAAMALVVATGSDTYLGGIAKMLNGRGEKSAFDRGVSSVSMLLVRLMLVMAPAVFAINAATKGNVIDALLFATSVAVGITPQMLPVIVTTSLSQGAKDLARRQVIVKELPAIQNLGAMDVLCCDKTGTLTEDRIVLERYLNTDGNEDARVLRHAFLNSFFQTGLKNLIDLAVIDRADVTPSTVAPDSMLGQSLRDRYTKVDEVPFDFSRRRLSVVVADAQGKTQMLTKGAAEEMLEICSFVEIDGIAQPLTKDRLAQIRKQIAGLNAEGLRVIAVAQKTNPRCVGEFGIADECDMALMGFLAFLDPPKASAAGAVATLEAKGVAVKVLTGDNDRVAATVCEQIGIDALDDAELAERAEKTHLFAKLSPLQKARLVRVMREMLGHTVGFMGDGINDAAAMRASDCGISVDSAVDIAKESADIILLQKDLGVLERGIIEGRRTYGNLLKYLKTTVSSNFGNVLSVTVASLFLPFLPMSALQLVLLSLVYEIVCIALPWDTVDDAWTARPRAWDAASIKGFMLELGPVSSLFDIVTFAALFFVVCPAAVDASWSELAAAGDVAGMATFAALFQSGWFVESMWSQTLVVHMLRSQHLPSPRDHAAPALCVLTVLGLALVTWLPASPIADALGLMPLPTSFFGLLIGIVTAYIALTQLAKRRYIARHGELL